MNDEDRFAAWIADAVLRASDEEFTAEALVDVVRRAEGNSLNEALAATITGKRRAGDFGLEIAGPMLSVILIEFGRTLWESYVKSLAEEAGKKLAGVTITTIKDLARKTWSGEHADVSIDVAERRLREAAERAKLNPTDTERLVRGMRSPEVAQSMTDG